MEPDLGARHSLGVVKAPPKRSLNGVPWKVK